MGVLSGAESVGVTFGTGLLESLTIMALDPGTRLGHYEVAESIGVGGMGEVYRALDTKLERDVAIKVLPEEFTRDEDRLARFEREAKLLASLNHPHIATLHGLENVDGTRFLVMELVEGETLAERLARGPLALEEAVSLFGQIAEAIEAAHRKGVVHRDLKPANIKITPEGKIKVLDFGLAKAFEADPTDQELSQSPTAAYTGTRAGVILGTAAYMSPEQARGKPIDKRTDMWSFGVCLYEALSGKKPFRGETATDTIAAVVRAEPEWRELPATTPTRLLSLVHRCLQKDPERRLRDMGDARLELEDALGEPAPVGAPATRISISVLVASVLVAAVVFLLLGRQIGSTSAGHVTGGRFSLELGADTRLALASRVSVAISPVGDTIAFVARADDGRRSLYVRDIASFEPRRIDGTESAVNPFFSPDGRWVGYFDPGSSEMRKVRVEGGTPITICETGDLPRGASWGLDDTIYFNNTYYLGLSRVSASGGEPQVLTVPDRAAGEKTHRFPEALPDGRSLLFVIGKSNISTYDDARIAVLSLDSGDVKVLSEGGNTPRYVSSGHIVYARAGTLMAAPFDDETLEIVGVPRKVLDGVVMSPNFGSAQFAVSSSGTLVYARGSTEQYETTVQLVQRGGEPQPIPIERGRYNSAVFSPDGARLALWRDAANGDVWTYDLTRQTMTRITAGWDNEVPLWTPDGQGLVFESNRAGAPNVFTTSAAGSETAELLFDEPGFPTSWSPDGNVLVLDVMGQGGDVAMWDRSTGEIRPLLSSPFNESRAIVSPDGRWAAYQSNASGRTEIYVTRFPSMDGRMQVSVDGASDRRSLAWSPDGRTLYYASGPRIVGVRVRAGTTFEAGLPETLFEFPNLMSFDVGPDGDTFVIITNNATPVTHLNVVLNWLDELEEVPR